MANKIKEECQTMPKLSSTNAKHLQECSVRLIDDLICNCAFSELRRDVLPVVIKLVNLSSLQVNLLTFIFAVACVDEC